MHHHFLDQCFSVHYVPWYRLYRFILGHTLQNSGVMACFRAFILIMLVCAFIYMRNRNDRPMFHDMKAEFKKDLSLLKDIV